MNIGTFTKQANGDFHGSIVTIGVVFQAVALEKINSTSPNAPAYIVTVDGGELGAAWIKTSKEGKEYLSVSLKGPFVTKPVYAALVESEKAPGNFALLWSETKDKD
jgi:uncharacterized protein (DUF736 family)